MVPHIFLTNRIIGPNTDVTTFSDKSLHAPLFFSKKKLSFAPGKDQKRKMKVLTVFKHLMINLVFITTPEQGTQLDSSM
jgi:hypothetical protein